MKPRPIAWFLGPPGEPIFAEGAYTVRIEDEAAGEYVAVDGHAPDGQEKLSIDIRDWPALRDAIDMAVKACRKDGE